MGKHNAYYSYFYTKIDAYKQNCPMTQTKLPIALIAIATILTSCGTGLPIRWDESAMVVDSVIQMAADGRILSRQAYYYDAEGRDTLITFEHGEGKGEARSTYNDKGKVMRRLVTLADHVTRIEYTYDNSGNLSQQDMTTESMDEKLHAHTIFTNDSTGRQTQSHSVTDAGDEVMISMTYDSHGNKESETHSVRQTGETEWVNEQRQEWVWEQTNSQDSAKWVQSAARLMMWEDGDWHEVSSEKNTYKDGRIVKQEQRADDVLLLITTEYDEAGNVRRELTYSTQNADAPLQETDIISGKEYKYVTNCKVETHFSWAAGRKEAELIIYTYARRR